MNSLCRSGVGKLRIVDFDQVTLSSLNRHAFALRKDVGISKVKCLTKYIKRIFPHIEVDARECFLKSDNISELIDGQPDYVIDCIDDLPSKCQLIAYCLKHKINVISSGGAGMKADPNKVQIRDLKDCTYDPLTKRMRDILREDYKMKKPDVKVVFSNEKPKMKLMPLKDFQKDDPSNYQTIKGLRVRIVPVLGTIPAMFGLTLASYVICQICDFPIK